MRRITEHRLDEGGFNEAISGLVRSSPWWMTSMVVHMLALLVFLNVPLWLDERAHARVIQVGGAEPVPIVEEDDFVPPKLRPPEEIEDKRLDLPDDEPQTTDIDVPLDETAGNEGEDNAPYTGPSSNPHIGLGPGPGGGRRGRGGDKDGPGGDGRGLTERAVELGLRWLYNHQDDDGKWDCDDFSKHDPADDRCDGPGGALYDVGVSGLALLAFLGAGYTDRGTHEFTSAVRKGVRYLMRRQDEDGCFGTRASQHFIYNHAIATLALCEAYWMTRNPRYRKPAQEGLNFIAMSRNPYLAWRYEPRGGENDTSVTGWMVMALKSGKYGSLDIDPDAFEGARQWIEKMTDPEFGQVGYNVPGGTPARPEGMQDRFPPEKSRSMTAVGMLTRVFLGEDPRSSPMIKKGAKLCLERPPVWNPDDGSIDMYYWYYASLAMFQVGGKAWKKWNAAMKNAFLKHQHPQGSGSRTGSWDPIGPWGHDGGRVYSTACMVMCLEVYYRYDRVFGVR